MAQETKTLPFGRSLSDEVVKNRVMEETIDQPKKTTIARVSEQTIPETSNDPTGLDIGNDAGNIQEGNEEENADMEQAEKETTKEKTEQDLTNSNEGGKLPVPLLMLGILFCLFMLWKRFNDDGGVKSGRWVVGQNGNEDYDAGYDPESFSSRQEM